MISGQKRWKIARYRTILSIYKLILKLTKYVIKSSTGLTYTGVQDVSIQPTVLPPL